MILGSKCQVINFEVWLLLSDWLHYWPSCCPLLSLPHWCGSGCERTHLPCKCRWPRGCHVRVSGGCRVEDHLQQGCCHWPRQSQPSFNWLTGNTSTSTHLHTGFVLKVCVCFYRFVTDGLAIMKWMSPCSLSHWCTSRSVGSSMCWKSTPTSSLLREWWHCRNLRFVI